MSGGDTNSTGRGLEGLGRRLLLPLLLALAAVVALAFVADAGELVAALGAFEPARLAPVLALSLVNYGLRFVRWEIYLRRLGVRLPTLESLAIFLCGFVLSVTPGKAGELGKAWLVRELGGGAARNVVAAVLAERVADLLAMLVLVSLGAFSFAGGAVVGAAGLTAVALIVGVLAWRRAARLVLRLGHKLPGVGGMADVLAEVYERFRELLAVSVLPATLALSVAAWAAEGIGFVLVARAYDPAATWLAGVFNYSASTLAGALSLLPGGLLASEGALTALLGFQGMNTAAAASATLIIRLATLWFAVALGLAAVPFVLSRLRRRRAAQGKRGG